VITLLATNPLLLLFTVAALGFLAGHVKLGGFNLGVAAVLFVGLGFGALDPRLALPEMVQTLGLVLFVYSVGVASGPGFFGSLRRRGLKLNLLVVGAEAATAALAVGAAGALGMKGPLAAGVFAGATTNTPALAGVIDALARSAAAGADPGAKLMPVVGYSLAYPFGVLGALGAIFFAKKWLEARAIDEAPASRSFAPTVGETIVSDTARVERVLPACGAHELKEQLRVHVVFSRLRRGDEVRTVTDDTELRQGDVVSIIGTPAHVEDAIRALGSRASEHMEMDRTTVDFRRIFVSRRDVVEVPLRDLPLGRRFGAVITRIRRGDIEFVPDDRTELELGDRVRVVAPRENMEAVSAFLGDSYKALSEVDLVPFGLGIALGLLLGIVPFPLWGGASFQLGMAGGPLIAGLVLGRLGRTGPLVWTLPYSAGLTLRQFGVVLFLAGVGTRSGWALSTTLRSGGALVPLLLVGGRLLKIPSSMLLGVVAGAQTQPADLAFANQLAGEMPTVGYTTVYPAATIAKIVLAQVVLLALSR